MINIKFPFDTKYFDIFEEEAVVISLTDQGGQISERQCVEIAFMLLDKENLENIMVYNPEKADTYRLMEILWKKQDQLDFKIQIEEVREYAI